MRICFVCSGNICRSPSAEIVMRELVRGAGSADEIEVCSAGLGDWHVGERADPRSAEALTARGYDASSHRARQFQREWFDEHASWWRWTGPTCVICAGWPAQRSWRRCDC